jgi:TonB family protein
MMNEPIKNISLKFNCPVDWNSMEALNDGRYCSHCQKKVYDLTDSKQDAFLKLLAENNNNICGRFRQEQMAPTHFALPAWKKWLSAAVVLMGFNVFSNKIEAQNTKPTVAQKQALKDIVMGQPIPIGSAIQEPAEFPGGIAAYLHFIEKNAHRTKEIQTGRVVIGFTINIDGSLGNYKILRSISPATDSEALRVIKLSPKWKPATSNGKPMASNFTIPIDF